MMTGLVLPAAVPTPALALVTRVQGTDVSNLTTVTSWPSVKAAGMSFVGVEAIQGQSIKNTQYDSQVTGAMSAGLYVMPYVFADPGKIADGGTQFSDAWAIINGIPGKPYTRGGQLLPIVLDMESDPINFPGEPCYGLTQTAMRTWIQQFATAVVNQTGAAPTMYSNPSWWAGCVGDANPFGADPLWIADYGVSAPAVPSGWNNYTFWQSSDTATISGINGQADLDYLGPLEQVTPVGEAMAPVQIRTLTSLAGGPAESFAASGLPPGLAMSSAGQVTGTPASMGIYSATVTVTPSSAVPSSITIVWDVDTMAVAPPGGQRGSPSPVATPCATPARCQLPVIVNDPGARCATACRVPRESPPSTGGGRSSSRARPGGRTCGPRRAPSSG